MSDDIIHLDGISFVLKGKKEQDYITINDIKEALDEVDGNLKVKVPFESEYIKGKKHTVLGFDIDVRHMTLIPGGK